MRARSKIYFGVKLVSKGLDFSLGIGPLFPLKEGEEGPFMMDFVLGYSF